MPIIVCALLTLILSAASAEAAIEVYSAGKYFDSFEEYSLKESFSRPNQVQDHDEEETSGINQITYDQGVHLQLEQFGKQSASLISKPVGETDKLEGVIREAVEDQSDPVLLISGPGKMRIVSYHPQDQASLEAKIENVDKVLKK